MGQTEQKQKELLTVYRQIVAEPGAVALSSIMFATGLSKRAVRRACETLADGGWIEPAPDYATVEDSGQMAQLLYDKAQALRDSADSISAHLPAYEVRKIREDLGLSQAALSKKLGINRSLLAMIETNQRTAQPEILCALRKMHAQKCV